MTCNKYTLGLDLGIASVGWAVLDSDHIIALGVRAFDKAEVAKTGESLNLQRRSARLGRRRLRHRRQRLAKLARLLETSSIITKEQLFATQKRGSNSSPWDLRVKGLKECLTGEEWGRVIYHICKHRGFHWVSRAEEKKSGENAKQEGGQVKQALKSTRDLFASKKYRSAAEMIIAEFPDAQRNKHGNYEKAMSRTLLSEELELLFQKQSGFKNPHATDVLKNTVLGNGDKKTGLLWEQKPALSGDALLAMLGKCTFERQEYRAPRRSFTAERHVLLTQLNNLRITIGGVRRPLTNNERRCALALPYELATGIKYSRLRSALEKICGTPSEFTFVGLAYPSEFQKQEEKEKNPEEAVVFKLPGWHELRTTLKKAGLEDEWKKLTAPALEGDPALLDQVAWVLSVYKEDEEVAAALDDLLLPNKEAVIDALLSVQFSEFHTLSLKALRNIVPKMELGLRYDEACEQSGYDHSQPFDPERRKSQSLPPFYLGHDHLSRMRLNEDVGDLPRNPIVMRALNQARKVVNALVRKYGAPHSVHIEMARDLSRPLTERKKIQRSQDEYRDKNDKNRSFFIEQFDREPRGQEFQKFQLYREQSGKCLYSLAPLSVERLLEIGYVEIDHVLPYSRSYDDSKNNKALVLTKQNRDKGDLTPYEYLQGAQDTDAWIRFSAFVKSNKNYRAAKRNRLLTKDFDEENAKDFQERNLNDTRYICRYFKSYLEQYLELSDKSEHRRCVVVNGQLTAFLRARWGLQKERSESDRHHALDAAVVAACTRGMVKRLADHAKGRELRYARADSIDRETGEIIDLDRYRKLENEFPQPWDGFRGELLARLNIDDVSSLRASLSQLGTYNREGIEAAKPLFVSRAPQRRNSGAAHKETIYRQTTRLREERKVSQKIKLAGLKFKNTEEIEAFVEKLVDPHRNEKLYDAIRDRLKAFAGDGKKAFGAENSFYKPDKAGNLTGPIVRSVTMAETTSGIPVRGGLAKNETMLRTDVFSKGGKHYLVPVYVHHKVTGLPHHAIVGGKDEAEWIKVDDTFAFVFSLYPNDLLQVCVKEKTLLGYFSGCDRSTGCIHLWAHDRASKVGKNGLIRSIGIRSAKQLIKLEVDVLGNRFRAKAGKRDGLA
jgi:CRISPR-associated endonuclease Csn1